MTVNPNAGTKAPNPKAAMYKLSKCAAPATEGSRRAADSTVPILGQYTCQSARFDYCVNPCLDIWTQIHTIIRFTGFVRTNASCASPGAMQAERHRVRIAATVAKLAEEPLSAR
jgi:hypothetical protein